SGVSLVSSGADRGPSRIFQPADEVLADCLPFLSHRQAHEPIALHRVQLLLYFLHAGARGADPLPLAIGADTKVQEAAKPPGLVLPNGARALPGPAFLLWLSSRSWHHEPSFSRCRCLNCLM